MIDSVDPAKHVLTLPVAPLNAEIAEVEVWFHGDYLTATYIRSGLSQLWVFEDRLYVKVNPDFDAQYWDFRGAEEGEERRPDAVFECNKRS
ncbi:MAG: hypothetical protein GWN47_00270 [Woeseiaceae bacterium]|nr:hypothetical protein [Woeseiaceae bacterium]